jgi:hypothetical protein
MNKEESRVDSRVDVVEFIYECIVYKNRFHGALLSEGVPVVRAAPFAAPVGPLLAWHARRALSMHEHAVAPW